MLRLRFGNSAPAVQEDGKYLPARGLLYSLLVHEIAFFAVAIFSISGPPLEKPPDLVTMIDLRETDVLYLPLPELGGAQPARAATEPAAGSSGSGLVYPGPQPVFSDFPEITNRIQTLLQPALKDPVILPPPLSLPNLVQVPDYQPGPPLPRPETAARLPSIQMTAPAIINSSATLPVQLPDINIARPAAPLQQAARLPQIRYSDPAALQQPSLLLPAQIPEANVSRPAAPLQQAARLPQVRYSDPAALQQPSLLLPVQIPEADVSRPAAPLQQAAALPQIRESSPAVVTQPSVLLPAQIPEANVTRPAAPVQQAATLPQIRYTNPAVLPQSSVALPAQIPRADIQRPAAPPQQVASLPSVRYTPPANVQQTATLPVQLPTAPSPPPPAAPAGATRGNTPLVALSPTPATADEIVRVPAGEARGRFAIGPQPNLDGNENEPPGNGRGASGVRGGSSTTATAPASGAAATKDGSGTTNGGSNTTPGTGPAGASGPNAFPGITILGAGAMVENGRVSRGATSSPAPPMSTSYGLTVLSTGASGGGLPQFGVFASTDQIHTVFLDMRRSMFDTSPSWTFQYALLKPPSETETARTNQQGLVLPFPTTKEPPALPAEVARRHLNKMIIVYGIVTESGKMESLEIKQSPDAALNAAVTNALSKWVFKPAEFNGDTVAVKMLLGIPVSLP